MASYRDRIYGFLIAMVPNKPLKFGCNNDKMAINFTGEEGKTPEEQKLEFIEIVKDFIRENNDTFYGFMLEFSSDYTSIRKLLRPKAR